jgi:hypothetical protein
MGRLTRGKWLGWAVVIGAVALGMASNASAQPWIIQPVPAVNPTTLVAVSCSSSTACMAVGNIGLIEYTVPLAARWYGGSWILQSPVMPPGASSAELDGVSCVSVTDCVAVGMSNYQFPVAGGMVTGDGPLAEHWDGLAWTIMPTPNPSAIGASRPSPPDARLLGVSCASSTSCTAVGYYTKHSRRMPYNSSSPTLAERWDGTRWTVQATPTPEPLPGGGVVIGGVLNAVSCPSVSACMAGGDIVAFGGSLAESWNGRKWSIQKTDDPPNLFPASFNGVACTSPRACVAAGTSTNLTSNEVSPLAERWDGTDWWRMSIVVPPTGRSGMYDSGFVGVSCVSSTACVAVGGADGPNLIELWNGADWAIEPAPSPPGAQDSRLGGVSCSGTFCTAVGEYGSPTTGAFAQALASTVVSTPVVSTPAGISITGVRATPLRQGCVTEIGTSERDVNAVIADANCRHFRLTVSGIMEVGGRLVRTAGGEVTGTIVVKLPRGPVRASARTTAAAGRWRLSLVVPGINLDPLPPSYLIVVHYGGANSGGPVSAERRIRVESEPVGL